MCFLLLIPTPNLCQMLAWQHIPQPLQQTSNTGSFCSSPRHWQEWACVCQDWLRPQNCWSNCQIVQTLRHCSPLPKCDPILFVGQLSVTLCKQSLMWLKNMVHVDFSPIQQIFFSHENVFRIQYFKSWSRVILHYVSLRFVVRCRKKNVRETCRSLSNKYVLISFIRMVIMALRKWLVINPRTCTDCWPVLQGHCQIKCSAHSVQTTVQNTLLS